MSPEWISSCSVSETSCGGEEYEHNNECQATDVSGQGWSSEVVALCLEDRASGRELPHGNGPSLPRNEGCVLSELRVSGFPLFTVIMVLERFSCGSVTAAKAFLSTWTGCDD